MTEGNHSMRRKGNGVAPPSPRNGCPQRGVSVSTPFQAGIKCPGRQHWLLSKASMMIKLCTINHDFDDLIQKYDIVDKNTPFGDPFRLRGVACAQSSAFA
jgi:hypothetical protein